MNVAYLPLCSLLGFRGSQCQRVLYDVRSELLRDSIDAQEEREASTVENVLASEMFPLRERIPVAYRVRRALFNTRAHEECCAMRGAAEK